MRLRSWGKRRIKELSLVRWNPVLLNKKEYCLFCRNIDSMLGGGCIGSKVFPHKASMLSQ